MPSGPSSLNENGTVIRRPSNSGIATCIAASTGASAALEASHCARELVRHRPCSTGTSRLASTPAFQSLSPVASAGAEHGGDHHGGRLEQVGKFGVGPSVASTAERGAEDGQRRGPGGGQGGAQGIDEIGRAHV